MMANSQASSVLNDWVIEDVIAKIKQEYGGQEADMDILQKLTQTWREKLKLAESRAEDSASAFGAAAALASGSNGATPLTAAQDHFPDQIPNAAQNGSTAGPSRSGPTTPTSQLRTQNLDDEDLGSDLDDDEEDEGNNIKNIVLCQYEKVARTKNKWRATLKDGTLTVFDRDLIFSKASGDFEF